MTLLSLRWQYSFFQMLAYLASHMDGQPEVREHQSAADEAHRLWTVEGIQ